MATPHRPLPRVAGIIGSLTVGRAVLIVIGVALTLTTVAASLMRLVNPDGFATIGDSAWWAIVTLATVGYGDVVPTNSAGRLLAVLVILTSMAVFPVLTGLLTAALVARASSQRAAEAERRDEERAAALMARLDALEKRLIERDPGGPPPAG